jgi:hypothetical protein
MSMEMDVATDVVSEALIVNEAEKAAGGSHAAKVHAPAGNCANCGTPLTGAYCHACGQSAHSSLSAAYGRRVFTRIAAL